jgi:CheY-like chemotaxis protein
MVGPLRILHLEDVGEDAELVRERLAAEGVVAEIRHVNDRAGYEAALAAGGFDLILADHSLPGFDGKLALRLAVERCPDAPFLFVSGSIGEETAVELLKAGGTDYIIKDRLTRLAPAVRRALKEAEERAARRRVEEAAVYARSREPIAAVISDVRMPVMDGHAAIRALRRIDPAVKVVASSGLGESVGEGIETIRKPHTARDLLEVLARLLGRGPRAEPSA